MKKLNQILILVLFIFWFFLQSFEKNQNTTFNFDSVKNFGNFNIVDISSPTNSNLYDGKIDLIKEGDNTNTKLIQKIKLSNELDIFHLAYNYIYPYFNVNDCEYIQFNDTMICIEEVIKANINNVKFKSGLRIIFDKTINVFSVSQKKYIVLGASDRSFYRNVERNYWLIIEFNEKDIERTFSFVDGYNLDSKCFGDFNNDGNLDYLNWNFNKNKIDFYTLINNKFIINNNKFIYVIPSKSQIDLMKKGEFVLFDIIDKRKTKWFYEL